MQIYTSLSDRLKSQHEAIEMIISGVDEERMFKRPMPEKWNIHDNIAHLAKYQPVFIERISQILSIDKPSFDRYKAEDDPEFETWRAWSTRDLMQRLTTDRQGLFEFIISISEKERQRIGFHQKYGPLNVMQWTEFFLLHEAHHIFTIFQLAHDTGL